MAWGERLRQAAVAVIIYSLVGWLIPGMELGGIALPILAGVMASLLTGWTQGVVGDALGEDSHGLFSLVFSGGALYGLGKFLGASIPWWGAFLAAMVIGIVETNRRMRIG